MKLVFDGRTKAGKAEKLKAAQEEEEEMFGSSAISSSQFMSEQDESNKRMRALMESMDFRGSLDTPKKMRIGGDHYVRMDIQPWAAMEAWMTPEQYVGFLRGNAIKYLARCDVKGGLDDIKKAHHYLTELIEFSKGQE